MLPDGRQVSPFHVPHWWSDAGVQAEGGLMAALRGEWPCAPFGYVTPPETFTPRWQAVMDPSEPAGEVHGHSANHAWTFDAVDGDRIEMSIAYPDNDDVAGLKRVIQGVPGKPALVFELHIFARRAASVPVALHGCFRLPPTVGDVRLEPGPFREGRTYPGSIEPGHALFASDAGFTDLTAAPGKDGAPVDATRLPLAAEIEEVLQLNGANGEFCLLNTAENYRMRFTWDHAILPSVVLWFSNRGRQAAPWNGRHLCFGIEPACTPFGLSRGTATRPNPLNEAGTPTAVPIHPDAPTVIKYRIAADPA